MRVLITGGTGFIGSRLVRRCLDRGDTVRVFGQVNTPAEKENKKSLEDSGAEFIIGSVTDKEDVKKAVTDVDLIFHLAAAQHEANVPDQHFRDVNVEGTRNIAEAAVDAGVKRLVHGSTIGVYGDASEGRVNEESATNPANIYGETKKEGEQVALSFNDKMPVVVVRIPETYGPGDRRLLKLFKMVNNGKFFNIGGGLNKHHVMYVDDLIDGFFAAAEHENAPDQIFLLAGNDVLTTNEMIAAVAKSVGQDAPKLRVPLFPFMMAAIVLETTLKPLGIQPPLHRRRMDFFVKSFELDGSKAANVIGFKPKTTFEAGAKQTADWYRDNGMM